MDYKELLTELESLIEEYATRSLQPQWHRASLKDKPRDSDNYGVSRFLNYVFQEGGGADERSNFHSLFNQLVMSKLVEIQGGQYVDQRTPEQYEEDKRHPGTRFNSPRGIKFLKQ